MDEETKQAILTIRDIAVENEANRLRAEISRLKASIENPVAVPQLSYVEQHPEDWASIGQKLENYAYKPKSFLDKLGAFLCGDLT